MGTCISTSFCCCHLCDKKSVNLSSNCCKRIFIKTNQENSGKTNFNISIN